MRCQSFVSYLTFSRRTQPRAPALPPPPHGAISNACSGITSSKPQYKLNESPGLPLSPPHRTHRAAPSCRRDPRVELDTSAGQMELEMRDGHSQFHRSRSRSTLDDLGWPASASARRVAFGFSYVSFDIRSVAIKRQRGQHMGQPNGGSGESELPDRIRNRKYLPAWAYML